MFNILTFKQFNENYEINLKNKEKDQVIEEVITKIFNLLEDKRFNTILEEIIKNYNNYKKGNYSNLTDDIKEKFQQRYKDSIENKDISWDLALKKLDKSIIEDIILKESFATTITANIPKFKAVINNKRVNIEFNKNGIDLASYFMLETKKSSDLKIIMDNLKKILTNILKEKI